MLRPVTKNNKLVKIINIVSPLNISKVCNISEDKFNSCIETAIANIRISYSDAESMQSVAVIIGIDFNPVLKLSKPINITRIAETQIVIESSFSKLVLIMAYRRTS